MVKPKDKIKEQVKNKDDDEITLDFSFFTKIFKSDKSNKKNKHKKSYKSSNDEIELDLGKIKKTFDFIRTHKTWFLILIPLFLSIYLRMMPSYLPITDDWAKSTVYNNIKVNIANLVSQKYPNLPPQNKQILVEQEFNNYLKQNSDQINQQIKYLSNYFKDKMKDEKGNTYLLAIDPYFWLRITRHYIAHKNPGTTYMGGNYGVTEAVKIMYPNLDFSKPMPWDGQRMAPVGSTTKMNFHTYFIYYWYKFLNLFKPISLMGADFYVPIIISALTIFPAYFIGRFLAGEVGGLFSAILLSVHTSFLTRTAGGFSDTDPYNVLFPLLIVWLMVIVFEQKEISLKYKFLISSLAGFFTGIFAYVWNYWFIFVITVGAIIGYIGFDYFIKLSKHKKRLKRKKNNFVKILFNENLKIFLTYFISSGVFVSLFTTFRNFSNSFLTAYKMAVGFKAVAKYSIWPTIGTTVAELNSASWSQIVSAMGGKLLMGMAILGLILNFYDLGDKKLKINFSTLVLAAWLIASIYATFKGIRFTLLMTPPFVIAVGIFLGKLYRTLIIAFDHLMDEDSKIYKTIYQIVLIGILFLLIISPIKAGFNTAKHEVPSMNDAWWNSLTKIKEKSNPDSIINSWWDFGHWFITIANRSVTFDGAGQDRHMAYWIGRSLMVNSERYTAGILNMVDCGNNNAYYLLHKYLNDTGVKSIEVLNKIVLQDTSEARKTLESLGLSKEQVDKVLKYSKCNPPDDYYITSDDMVGKSGVWAHFGSWNFTKAYMYYEVSKMDEKTGIEFLKKNFSMDDDLAYKTYYEIKNKDPDHWIAPWPSYMGSYRCSLKDDTFYCGAIKINIKNRSALIGTQKGWIKPYSLVYVDGDDLKELIIDPSSRISISLVPRDNSYIAVLSDKVLAMSTFNRLFYFKGHGLKCFKLFSYERSFSGNEIYVWKVDWNCSSKRVVKEFMMPYEIRVRHILVNSSKEAQKILELLKRGYDFGDLAKKYSIGPSSKFGGDLGFFKRGMMVKPFEEAAFNLTKLGEISGIVKTQFGYHIIQLIGTKRYGVVKLWKGLNKNKEINIKKQVINTT